MTVRALLSLAAFFAAASLASAQVQVSAQTERTNYLLYERVDLLVTIQNLGDTPIVLDNSPGHPWLSFLISKHNRLPVRPERQSNFAAINLKVGETKTLRVNLTPLFAFREEGQYQAEAVVDLPGAGQVLSPSIPFNIVEGKAVWSQARPVDSAQRIYSLIRFSPDADSTRLYLRVENPSENVVYTNLSLGNLASNRDPEVNFDPSGNLHILQPIAMSTYLYTRTDANGKVVDQTVFKSLTAQDASGTMKIPPRLRKVEDGNVVVVGGKAEDPNAPHDKLSDTQQLPNAKPPKRAPPVALPVSTP